MGATVKSGFSFYWNNGFYPCLVSGKTNQIFILDVSGDLPIMVQGGGFEKITDQKILQALTGVHVSTVGGETTVTHKMLKQSEASVCLETCHALREYAMSLGQTTACAANGDEEMDDERAEEKRLNRREIAEQIKRESELRGASSSSDAAPDSGIVFRGNVKTLAYDLTKKIILEGDDDKEKHSEQGSENLDEIKCEKCGNLKNSISLNSLKRCKCDDFTGDFNETDALDTTGEEDQVDGTKDSTDKELLTDLATKLEEVCKKCEYCKSGIMEPCKFLCKDGPRRPCQIHEQIFKARRDIHVLTQECSDVWIPEMELTILNHHRNRLRRVKCRKNCTKYEGGLESEKLVTELDNTFKPITEPEFHDVPDRTEPSIGTPTDDDVGINLLNKSLRDRTGVLHETKHMLTHEADTLSGSVQRLKGHPTPCLICTKAASRQKRKYSEKFRDNQVKYEHRNVTDVGDQQTGDYIVMTDPYGRGGVHGARNLYAHKDLITKRISGAPTSRQDDEQTYAAMKQILGNLPRRSYYSDNQRCLNSSARRCGMTVEYSLPGVSQTNAVAEANNKTILNGTRKVLCQAGLPAAWWTYAAPCFCFLKNVMLSHTF